MRYWAQFSRITVNERRSWIISGFGGKLEIVFVILYTIANGQGVDKVFSKGVDRKSTFSPFM